MSDQQQRPPSSRAAGGAGGRPGTASRPRTGANRPTTATVRPGTASRNPAAAGTQPPEQDQYASGYGHTTTAYMDHWADDDEYDPRHDGAILDMDDVEEEDEDDYESDDDGDVFAFVPPDIGPSATLTANPSDPVVSPHPPPSSAGVLPSADQSARSQQQQSQQQRPGTALTNRTAVGSASGRPPSAVAMPPGTAGSMGLEDETFYYDEATGAVYDSQGRLVQMPAGFDPSAVMDQQPAVAADPAPPHSSTQASDPSGMGLDSVIQRTDPQRQVQQQDYTFPYGSNGLSAGGSAGAVGMAGAPGAGAQGSQPSFLMHPQVANLSQTGGFSSLDDHDRSRKDSQQSSVNSMDASAPLRHAPSVGMMHMAPSSDALAPQDSQAGTARGSMSDATEGAAIRRRQGSLVRRSLQDPLSMATAGLAATSTTVDTNGSVLSDSHHIGIAYGGDDGPVGPNITAGGRQSSHPLGQQTDLSQTSSEDSSDDSKLKMDGDMMLMLGSDGEYYGYPHTLNSSDPKALEAAGLSTGGSGGMFMAPNGEMMMVDPNNMSMYALGMGQGLAHPVHEGQIVGPRGVRIVELEMESEEDSPYAEVRASVSNVDDPDMPVNTIRMWFMAIIILTIAGGANQLFALRIPAVFLTPVIIQLISYPFGKFLAATLPIRIWTLPRWLGGASFSLNPGMFNIKEHTAIYIMGNVATGPLYALTMSIVLEHPIYYGQKHSIGFQFLLSLTSQLFAFSFAGFCRGLLVYPASMIWPLNLVVATIFNTLHAEDDGEDGTMTRFRFFTVAGIAAAVWYWFPGFIFTALSAFNFICWIWPTSRVVNILFGINTGLGMSLITFDWSQIAFTGNPLVIPWWAQCNLFAGFVMIVWILTPALYFTNTLDFAYLPITGSGAFDRTGQRYDVRNIVAGDGQTLDLDAYMQYSRINLTTTFFMTFWTGFATAAALLTHTVLYHGNAILAGLRYGKVEEDDIHAKHMRVYREAPTWWYASVLVVSFVVAVVTVEIYNTGLPVWALVLAMLLPAIYILPTGFLYALTGQLFGLNLVSEFIAGYTLPGKVVPNMLFKVYAQTGLGAATNFLQDLKLGHYMKIPPRTTFMIQLVASAWCPIVQVGVKTWAFNNIPDVCTEDARNHFYCPQAQTFYTASVIFGILGPDRSFGSKSQYSSMYWGLLFGFLIPIPFWIMGKKWPKSIARWISWPIILTGSSFIPPASGINLTSWFVAGLIFQFLVRKYKFRWWSKYNFVLAAALDAGTIVSSLIIFLTLSLPKNGDIAINWWGNSVYANTLDFEGVTLKDVPEAGFGPLPTQ
ncbi:hypothetical protein OC845_005226 [Tilletia horrida]|nr:hypothetical protein OC845_005226 [Tilletia horrida]